ncbi:hypothetical protein Dsin_019034 [Dipteronia sinensis]|uniref:Uncharacterized protein n=1 Tax=Dipteronia sinensis TaxID=43782 RepID=A0AAE0E2G2_9ROSI|nr:hypothetical protein Dsin_019034 [Dipteronia sinensis]
MTFKTYPEAKQFLQKPLANFEELDSLFSGVSTIRAHNWISRMQWIPEWATRQLVLHRQCMVEVMLGYWRKMIPTPNSDVNFEEHSIQNEKQPKKQKKRKVDGNRQDVDRIINALEKSDDRGPSGAIGAIDGTLIHASIPIEEQVPYRGRGKGECYQNVLAICNFDIICRYVVIG